MNAMKMGNRRLALAVAAACATAAPAMAQDVPAGLEVVIVSAERVEGNLQTTPIAVTALTAERLEQAQVTTTTDLSNLVPNLKLDQVSGGTATLKPYLRGGGTTDGGLATSESAIGFYVDDVYRGRLSGGNLDLLDLERIEVLRGPQGTLYGRNSSTGAVRFVSRQPGEEFRLNASLGYGEWDEFRARASADGALDDAGRWRLGVSGAYRTREGGRQDNIALGREVGETDFAGARVQLKFVPSENFDARLSLHYVDDESDGQWPVAIDPNADPSDFDALQPVTGSYYKVLSQTESYSEFEETGLALHLRWDLGATELRSITAWSTLDDGWKQDFSGGVGALFGLPPSLSSLFVREAITEQEQFSQEFELLGTALEERLQWIVGLYYFNETPDQVINDVFVLPILPFPPFFAAIPLPKAFEAETESYAAFAQASWHFADAWTATLGGRYTRDDKSLDAVWPDGPVSRDDEFSRFTPRLGLDWQVSDDLFAYLSYSEGFKAGGYQGLAQSSAQLGTPFDEEVVKAWEIGLKADLLDDTLRVNLALFQNDFDDIQQQIALGDGSVLTENYDARLRGIELESTYLVTDGIRVYVNAAFNDDEYTGTPSGGGLLAGESMPVVPEWQALLGFDADRPLGERFDLLMGASLSYRDGYFSTPDNAPIGQVPSQAFLDAYLGVETRDGRWKAVLSGKNLADESGWQTGFAFGVIRPRYAIDPRTWAFTVSYAVH